MTQSVERIISDREKIYGSFETNADVAVRLERVLADAASDRSDLPITPMMQLAIKMIALKLSRIVTGDPTHIDNWDDIAGYATLVADRLRRDAA